MHRLEFPTARCLLRGWPAWWVAAVTAVEMGCERAPLSDGLPDTMDCSSCHGTPGNPAPPPDCTGETSTAAIGVGAHSAHAGNRIAAPVPCTECHVMPVDLLSHPDPGGGPAGGGRPSPLDGGRGGAVVFGPRAQVLGAVPSWDRTAASCAGTYCHGATLSEAETRTVPVWTRVDGSQASCTACHGNPPGGTHPADPACENCHGSVVAAGGLIIAPGLHIDGKVDLGNAATANPPGYAAPELHGPGARAPGVGTAQPRPASVETVRSSSL